ncbi:MAG TPA: LytR C-terminal domain-containing protein [Actinomycetota bacterium]|nr:LytR C-terminal domain-containing protein [Actinomycetota bacterium]
MGRHSSGASWPFVRSVLGWIVPWLVGAILIGGAAWGSVTWVGGDDAVAPPAAPSSSAAPEPDPSPTPVPTPASSASATPEPEPRKPDRRGEKEDGDRPASFAGTSVQVLNGTGGVTGAAERMADRLARLGFEVIAVDDALGNFPHTTVYWTSDSSRPQAEALAVRYGWRAEPRRTNLSPTVDVHVIVGLDEA